MNLGKRIFFGAMFFALGCVIHAQESIGTPLQEELSPSITEILNASGIISVMHPDALEMRLKPLSPEESQAIEKEKETKTAQKRTAGYRVQVFSDNNARTAKSEAKAKAKAIATSLPKYPTYVVYTSPYWRLKVGDFKTKEEADKAAEEIKRAFPSYGKEIRVVRDRINTQR